MTSYLPRFTLRRTLIAIGLLALFLGWLRPDRARYQAHVRSASLELFPLVYLRVIAIYEGRRGPNNMEWEFHVE